jgi:hypothetical protein
MYRYYISRNPIVESGEGTDMYKVIVQHRITGEDKEYFVEAETEEKAKEKAKGLSIGVSSPFSIEDPLEYNVQAADE